MRDIRLGMYGLGRVRVRVRVVEVSSSIHPL